MKKSIETTIGVTNVTGFSAVGRSKRPSENVEDAHVPWEIIPDTMVGKWGLAIANNLCGTA
jgi:hypothetical protein